MIYKSVVFIVITIVFFCAFDCAEIEIIEFEEVCELSEELREISGMIPFNENILAFGDSGSAESLFEINTNCKIVSEYKIEGATNRDWEAIAESDSFIYIGDFGNNAGDRKDLKILKIQKSELSESTKIYSTLNFSYEDQLEFGEDALHNFDCEAFLVDGISIFLFTKNRGSELTHVYELNTIEVDQIARRRMDLEISNLVTDAYYNKSNQRVFLTSYSDVITNNRFIPSFYSLNFIDQKFSIGINDREIMFDTQIESICTLNDSMYIAAEAETSGNSILYSVHTEEYLEQF